MLPHPTSLRLANGLTIVITPNPMADIIAARLLLKAGSSLEPPDKMGLVHLLSAVLTKGTQQRSSLAIAEAVEYVGAGLGTDSGTDSFALSLKSISSDFPALLQLAAELLQQPSFPEHEVELERSMVLQSIRAQQEYPFTIAFDQLRSHLYGSHPYGYPGLGTAETVQNLTRSDLQAFHATHFRPDRLIISIAGRVEVEQALDWVTETLGQWTAPAESPPVPPLAEIQSGAAKTLYTHQDTHQSAVALGYLTTNVHDRAYAPLKLISSYLGNGMSSRLFTELREKQGLAYEVSAFFSTRLHPALFVVYLGTAPHNLPVAIESLRREVDRLHEIPLTDSELQASKNKLLGQYALGKQTNAQLAQLFGWYELLGLGVGYDQTFTEQIQAVTIADIQTIAEAYLQNPCQSIVGSQAPEETTPPGAAGCGLRISQHTKTYNN